jgi:polyhydroxybutyrate depolymerase
MRDGARKRLPVMPRWAAGPIAVACLLVGTAGLVRLHSADHTAAPSTKSSESRRPTTTVTVAPTTTITVAPILQPPWVTTTGTLVAAGLTRRYLVSRPASASGAKLPVLVELQGCCLPVDQEEQRSGFLGVTGPAILVYPAGYGPAGDEGWNAGTCCHTAQADGVDDVGFITMLVQDILATQPDAAADQIYLAGYSNGGKMALLMACDRPRLFAAIAAYGAVNALPCPQPAPVSLLEMASTGDPELTIGPGGPPKVVNGYTEPTVEEQADLYRRADGCTTVAATRTQGALTLSTWAQCTTPQTVELALYRGGDHGWPVGDATTPSGEQVMWDFFRRKAR